jgi:hypothetical protein
MTRHGLGLGLGYDAAFLLLHMSLGFPRRLTLDLADSCKFTSLTSGRLRYANNSNYRNDSLIRKERE